MRAVLQRTAEAAVSVDGAPRSQIGQGLVVLVGVAKGDSDADAGWLAAKTGNLRVFQDEAGKMNLSVKDVGGRVLAISQFTLLADCRKGRRPGFDGAAPPEEAERLFSAYVKFLEQEGCSVESGVFRAHMMVSLVNDGPVTIILDSSDRNPGA